MKMMKCITFALVIFLLISCASTGGGNAKLGTPGNWTFGDPEAGTAGWELANNEFYQYHGTINLSRDDTTLGKGLLRLDVDFTKDAELEWSEPKMKNDFPKAYNMKGKTRFCFDFYYNPEFQTTPDGHFKAKVFSNNNGIHVDNTGDAIENFSDAGNGFKKAQVSILIMPVSGFMTDLRFSIAGYMTDYKGPVFFDNMRWE